MHQYKDYIKKSSKEGLITEVATLSTNRKTTKPRKKKWKEKQLYGYFKQQTGEIVYEKTWLWKGNLQRVSESLLIIFTNPSAQAGYDTRSIFKRSLTGLNSEFSFS